MKTHGNETYEPPFRGTIVISQNTQVNASDAILQRICHLFFDKSHHTRATQAAAQRLEKIPLEQLSPFILKACCLENTILSFIDTRISAYETQLNQHPDIHNFRIAKNHAQLMACVQALQQVLPINPHYLAQTQVFIEKMAIERQKAINLDHPLITEFWEIVEYLENDGEYSRVNHARDNALIAINLNHFSSIATEMKQKPPLLCDLKKLLKHSRMHKFIGIKTINSKIHAELNQRMSNEKKPATIKCWVFQKKY